MSKYIFNNDTDILEFLEQLRENGIQIWGEGEKIRYRSKNRQLAPETLRILKMAKGQILDFFRMIEKNVIPLTSIQTAYVVGQTAGCELGNINAHYYIEYTIESLDVERLEQMINLVISKNDALRLIVTHEGKASFLDNVPYYSVPVYSLYDGNDREQKRLERSHHRYNYYKWPMFHFCVGKTSGKTSVLHVDFDCIILDAWSAKLLLNEIFSLYYGKDVKFPRISFMNYMRLKTDKGDLEAEEYWKEKVKNMPSFPKLNYQKKFAEVQNVRFDRIECDFSFIETQRLYQKIKNYHFTPAAVISTIFMKTLAQYSETPGLSINVTLFNRQLLHEDVNGILGEFTNNAVISYQEKTDSLLDAIRATQEQMWRLVQYMAPNIQLFELDIDKESNIGKFFKGSDLVIGAIGPSADYSEKMLLGAMAENIPYVDPGGIHLIRKMRNSSMKGTAIVGSGIFPGLSGWMLSSVLKEAFNDDLIEMIIGGVYNFSKAAAIDYVEEIKSYKAGIPMACVRNGKILPAQKRSPLNLPTRISKLSILPYVTEEIQEIIQGKYMLNIDSYTAAPVSLFSIVNKAHCQKKDLVNALMGQKNSNQKAFIWVRQNKGNDSRCIYFEGKNPSVLTGEILAITANAIFEMPRKDGIYTMASYLEKYQVLDELKKIDKFKSEGKI